MIQTSEILDTLRMIDREKLDVRTITMGISLFPCVSDDIGALCRRVPARPNIWWLWARKSSASSACPSSTSASP